MKLIFFAMTTLSLFLINSAFADQMPPSTPMSPQITTQMPEQPQQQSLPFANEPRANQPEEGQSATDPKRTIKGVDASGHSQTTIVDDNGNLKMVKQPKMPPGMPALREPNADDNFIDRRGRSSDATNLQPGGNQAPANNPQQSAPPNQVPGSGQVLPNQSPATIQPDATATPNLIPPNNLNNGSSTQNYNNSAR